VTAASLLVNAAVIEGKWGQAMPFFGAERRGAPVVAYVRISDRPVRRHDPVSRPDIVVVLDTGIMEAVNPCEGLREGGLLLVNSSGGVDVSGLCGQGVRVCRVDASGIALRHGLRIAGWPAAGTAALGALARAAGIVGVDALAEAIRRRWGGSLAERNVSALMDGYREVVCGP